MAICVIAFCVFMERAQRRLLINYPKRQVGNRMYEGQTSFLPLKLNTAGVIPPIFASSLLLLPTTIASFSQASGGTGFLSLMATYLAHGRPAVHVPLCGADHLLLLLLHRDRVQSGRDGGQSQEAWRLHAGHPPGRAHRRAYRPVLTRITVLGAGYLTIVCLIPEFMITYAQIPIILWAARRC
jgi:preprotein translocase subunit SecY